MGKQWEREKSISLKAKKKKNLEVPEQFVSGGQCLMDTYSDKICCKSSRKSQHVLQQYNNHSTSAQSCWALIVCKLFLLKDWETLSYNVYCVALPGENSQVSRRINALIIESTLHQTQLPIGYFSNTVLRFLTIITGLLLTCSYLWVFFRW